MDEIPRRENLTQTPTRYSGANVFAVRNIVYSCAAIEARIVVEWFRREGVVRPIAAAFKQSRLNRHCD